MPIIKRRLDICGREKAWEYLVESAGQQYRVTARQVGRCEPAFDCSCGISVPEIAEDARGPEAVFAAFQMPCSHIAEAQRDLNIARQAAAQMLP